MRPCLQDDSWGWDGVRFSFLQNPGRGRGDNHDSCVLSIESAAGRRLLLTADIEARDERALIAARLGALRSDVLQVPHQGSKGASSADFIAAVAPAHALFPVGYRNRFRHPHPEVVARYADAGVTLWRTDRDGMLTVRLDDAVTVTSWRQQRPRYWHGR
jgi:competence protein ComEC